MTHFSFAFFDKKSRRKSIWQALDHCLFYIVSSIVLIYFIALAEPVGGMTDYEFIYKLCIFAGTPLIGAVVFALWCVRVFCSKKIGVDIFDNKLEIVRYCPLGVTFRLKLVVPYASIESIDLLTVNEEIRKKTQCQIYMPDGSACVVIKTVDKTALSFCTENNESLIASVQKALGRNGGE